MGILRFVMILGFVCLLGCENKQFIQCQQDLEAAQAQLKKAQNDNIEEKKVSEQMLSSLMLQQQEDIKKLQKQIEQARVDEKAKYEMALKDAYARRDELTRFILQLQGTVKQLSTKRNDLALQLAAAEKKTQEKENKIKNTGEMLQALAVENGKLKAENKRLQAMIDELQKKLEAGEKEGDAGDIEE